MVLSKIVKTWVCKHWQFLILSFFVIALFFIPTVFWGNLYIAGGDDARLYYLFPKQYLEHFLFNTIGNNTLGGNIGYGPVSYSVPFVFFLFSLKSVLPWWNTQSLVYGMILSFGFLFFYLFIRQWSGKNTGFIFWGAVISSCCYIFSPYITRTLYQSQLVSITLVAVVPCCLYFFTRGVREKTMVYVVISSLVYALGSSTVYSFPVFLPVVWTMMPFYVFLCWQYGWYVWKALFIFIGICFATNIYWIVHYFIPLFVKTGETSFTSSLLSSSLKEQNNDMIESLVYLNSPVNQMMSYLRSSGNERRGIGITDSIGGMYLLAILLAGTQLKKVQRGTQRLFILFVGILLFCMLFITPNFGEWNVRLFQFCNTYIPFFSIFRNMYNKFALAMAFHYAGGLFLAFVVLEEAVKTWRRYVILFLVSAVMIVLAFPYVRLQYHDDYFSTRISGKLNQDFWDLTAYIKEMRTSSRFLWLPMTFSGYVYINDEAGPNHFYVGISPLQFLSQASDLTGFYGIQTSMEPELGWNILELLKTRAFTDVGHILQKQNIGYVILNHERIPNGGYDVLNNFHFMEYQDETFIKTMLGEKIRDFGSRYSLYAINKDFFLPTVFVAPQKDDSSLQGGYQSVISQKNDDGSYDVSFNPPSEQMKLVLLEPYNRLWEITTSESRMAKKNRVVAPEPAYGFGNAWDIRDQSNIHIQFWPRNWTMPAFFISILAVVGSITYIGITLWKKR